MILETKNITLSPAKLFGKYTYGYDYTLGETTTNFVEPEISFDSFIELIEKNDGDMSEYSITIDGFSDWKIEEFKEIFEKYQKKVNIGVGFDFHAYGFDKIKSIGFLRLFSGHYINFEELSDIDIGTLKFIGDDGSGSFNININKETLLYVNTFDLEYHNIKFNGEGHIVFCKDIGVFKLALFQPYKDDKTIQAKLREDFGSHISNYIRFAPDIIAGKLTIDIPYYLYYKVDNNFANFIYNSNNVHLLNYINDCEEGKNTWIDLINNIKAENISISSNVDIHGNNIDIFEYLKNFTEIKNKTILIDWNYSSQDFKYNSNKHGDSYTKTEKINNYKVLQKINNNNVLITFDFGQNSYYSGRPFDIIHKMSMDIFNGENKFTYNEKERYYIGGKSELMKDTLANLIGATKNAEIVNKEKKSGYIKNFVSIFEGNLGKYAKIIEHNEWEGEDWNFYVLIDNNFLSFVEKFYSTIETIEDMDEYDNFEFVTSKFYTLKTINTLVDNSDGGYMAYENGPIVINKKNLDLFKKSETLEDVEEFLYKGGINDLCK